LQESLDDDEVVQGNDAPLMLPVIPEIQNPLPLKMRSMAAKLVEEVGVTLSMPT